MSTAPNAVPSGREGRPRGGVPDAQDGDVDSVALAVANVVVLFDTAIDRSPQDAARRAAVWMTPELAARQDATTNGGGAWWAQLARGQGYTTAAAVRDTEPPPPLPVDRAARRFTVTASPHVLKGAAPAPQRYTVTEMLTRTPQGWRVSDLRVLQTS